MSTDQVPAGWTRVRLGDVATRTSKRCAPELSTNVRWVGADHLDEGDLAVRRWSTTDDPMFPPTFKFSVPSGSVLLHSRNPNKVAILPFDAITGEKLFCLSPADQNVLASHFLAYQLQSDHFHEFVGRWLSGSVNKFLNWTALERYEFALPPIAEQRSIVEMLLSADGAIRAYSEARAANGRLRESILLDSIWDASVKDWRFPLIRVADLLVEPPRNGVSPPASPDGEGLLTVSISAVQEGKFVTKSEYLKWCRPVSDSSGFAVRANDAFAVRGNGNRSLVGRLGLCRESPRTEVLYPDLLIRLRFDPRIIDPEIATAVWNLGRVHERLLARAKSSNGIYKVNGQDIANHRLPVPPVEIQATLHRNLEKIDQVGKAVGESFGEGVQLRKSLLSRVLETSSNVQ